MLFGCHWYPGGFLGFRNAFFWRFRSSVEDQSIRSLFCSRPFYPFEIWVPLKVLDSSGEQCPACFFGASSPEWACPVGHCELFAVDLVLSNIWCSKPVFFGRSSCMVHCRCALAIESCQVSMESDAHLQGCWWSGRHQDQSFPHTFVVGFHDGLTSKNCWCFCWWMFLTGTDKFASLHSGWRSSETSSDTCIQNIHPECQRRFGMVSKQGKLTQSLSRDKHGYIMPCTRNKYILFSVKSSHFLKRTQPACCHKPSSVAADSRGSWGCFMFDVLFQDRDVSTAEKQRHLNFRCFSIILPSQQGF